MSETVRAPMMCVNMVNSTTLSIYTLGFNLYANLRRSPKRKVACAQIDFKETMQIQIIQGINKHEIEVVADPSHEGSASQANPKNRTGKQGTSDSVSDSGHSDSSSGCEDIRRHENGVRTFRDLKNKIQNITEIPAESLRLIHRGKTLLFNDDDSLEKLNLRENDKIMVLGHRKSSSEEDKIMSSLKRIDSSVIQGIDKKMSEVDSQLDGIAKGYLSDELVQESLRKLDRNLKSLGEDCMKTLELLDGISVGENMKAHRSKRKSLVDRLQGLLSSHDSIAERLNQIKADLNK